MFRRLCKQNCGDEFNLKCTSSQPRVNPPGSDKTDEGEEERITLWQAKRKNRFPNLLLLHFGFQQVVACFGIFSVIRGLV